VAAQYLRRMHGLVKAAGGDKPVIVDRDRLARQRPAGGRRRALGRERDALSSSTSSNGAAREGVKLFYFSSFDEPWKLAGRRSGHAVGSVGQGRAA
jgi:GPH family glycoside/pentoside/hexuronide:cation symporter